MSSEPGAEARGDVDAVRGAGADPTGIVYDIQGFSVQDGPGIRTTVFLKGCPLRCPWCHSPESQRFEVQLSWQWRKCIGTEVCGLCLDCCPHGAISPAAEATPAFEAGAVKEGAATGKAGAVAETATAAQGGARLVRLVEVDWHKCDDCGACAEQCPSGALSMWGKEYAVSEVVDRVVRDRPFFEKSGGGVTISGGEPLSQPEFTLALLEALEGEGLHTALDTTGSAPWSVIERVLPHVDLFLLDLKHMDPGVHKATVGVSNSRILENARRIATSGGKLQVRIPVIPRFNDSPDHLRAIGAFLEELGDAVTLVQLLPYHAMGVPKWERIRHDGPILEAVTPSDKKIDELKAILEEHGSTVQVH